MLKLNLQRILTLKGINDATAYLKSMGYQRTKAHNLATQKGKTVSLDDLDYFCRLFNCTPNDLLEWSPTKPEHDVKGHPLQQLRRKEQAVELVRLVQSLPVEEMAEVERIILERAKAREGV